MAVEDGIGGSRRDTEAPQDRSMRGKVRQGPQDVWAEQPSPGKGHLRKA